MTYAMKSHQLLYSVNSFFLATCIGASSSLAQASSELDLCKAIGAEKSYRTFLFDESGKNALPYFQLGHLDATVAKRDEYLVAKRFRLVLFPKQLRPEPSVGRDFAIDMVATKSHCPTTAAYILTFRINPTEMGPGEFDTEFQALRIIDPKLDFPERIEVKQTYEARVVGLVSMPWMLVNDSVATESVVKSLFASAKNSATITLNNSGDRPIKLGEWAAIDEQQKKEVIVLRNTCENVQIDPLGYCDITLGKVSEKSLTRTLYRWASTGKSGNFVLPVILDIEKFSEERFSIGVRSR